MKLFPKQMINWVSISVIIYLYILMQLRLDMFLFFMKGMLHNLLAVFGKFLEYSLLDQDRTIPDKKQEQRNKNKETRT